MKKLFQKIVSKLVKKAVKKAISNANEVTVPEVEPVVVESEVDVNKAQGPGGKLKDPWWVILLKVIAYIIGLILGGVATTSCISHF